MCDDGLLVVYEELVGVAQLGQAYVDVWLGDEGRLGVLVNVELRLRFPNLTMNNVSTALKMIPKDFFVFCTPPPPTHSPKSSAYIDAGQ